MTVNADQIAKGATAFYESELATKTSGIGQFTAYFILPSVPGIVRQKVAELAATPLANDLVNADGLIELELLRDRAQTAMQKCGSLEIMGFRLNSDDISKLYDYIRRS